MASCGTSIKNVLPLLFGFLVGSFLSLTLFPSVKRFSSQLCNTTILDDGDYEPAIVSQPPATSIYNQKGKKPPKFNRPRFYATELGVKDKLCVIILINSPNVTLAAALNKTLAHHVNKLIFVADSQTKTEVSGLSILTTSPGSGSKFYFSLNYVADHLMNNYDWFFIATDSTYIKAFKLYEFVTHLSVGFDVVMGKRSKSKYPQDFCPVSNGLLISNGALRKISRNLIRCSSDAGNQEDNGSAFESCISNYGSLNCLDEWNGKVFKSWDMPYSSYLDKGDSGLGGAREFNQVFTVAPVGSATDVFQLHKHFCNLELDQINNLMTTLEDSIANSTISSKEERLTWPHGLPASMHPKNRYEIFKWDFFTDKQIFEVSNDRNVRPLDGLNKKDIDNVITFISDKLKHSTIDGDEVQSIELISGYRKFDPSRGVDYVVDLDIGVNHEIIVKRYHVLRALSKAELVQVPYVTEATKVNIVVPVLADEGSKARQFLSSYSTNCLDVDENSRLILILLYSTIDEQNHFRNLLRDVDMIRRKYMKFKSGDKFLDAYLVRAAGSRGSLTAADFAVRLVGPDNLFFLTNVHAEVKGDFLNRLRMNTIVNFQVYFPTPFVQYHPKLVGSAGSERRLDVSKGNGRFDRYDFSMCGFYGVDLLKVRSEIGMDLVDMFLGAKSLHILRAVDPALSVGYRSVVCNPNLNEESYGSCLVSAKEGLASKSQLAALIFERGLY